MLARARALRGVALSVVVLASLMVVSGSLQKQAQAVHQTTLGSFYVSNVGSTVEADFRTGNCNTTNCNLGFEVQGIERDSKFFAQFDHVLSRLASGKLRLRLQLFSKNNTNDFYCADFALGGLAGGAHNWANDPGANYIYSGNLVKTYPLFLFTGISPLGFYNYYKPKNGDMIAYHPQAGTLSGQGNLLPDEDYKVKLTVLEPVDLTNQFQLVLYQYLH
jgi:hypothetical protein